MKYTNRLISDAQRNLYAAYEKGSIKKYFNQYGTYFNKFVSADELIIVDIGGGSGYFANKINEFYRLNNTNASVYVIDYCKYDEWHIFDNVNFIAESACIALEKFSDSCIDMIFMNLVLHHLVKDTYKDTRALQIKLLEIAYRKIKEGGFIFINECYYQNPILGDISIPIVYVMSSNKIQILTTLSRKLGSQSAGIGVCFLSKKVWLKIFVKIGFFVINSQETAWRWIKKCLIREKFFWFVLTKKSVIAQRGIRCDTRPPVLQD